MIAFGIVMNRTIVVPTEARGVAPQGPVGVNLRAPQVLSGVRNHESPREALPRSEELGSGAAHDAAQLGQILLSDGREKIAIDSVIGAGGMSIVYGGVHRVTGQAVAVKVMRSEHAQLPELVARFQREAEILASLGSPGVVRLLDCDVTSTGLPYIVLERLEGRDLGELLENRGRLRMQEAVSIVLDIARVLGPIHRKGIVHRDIKPDNVFLETGVDGSLGVKLVDFGVALARRGRHQLTQPGTTMGTPRYMSPEQLTECQSVNPASDIWSLGVMLFQLLSGELPFPGPSEAEYSSQVLNERAATLRAIAPSVPQHLSNIVARCLHKDPWKRFADGAQLASALVNYLELQRDPSIWAKPIHALQARTRRPAKVDTFTSRPTARSHMMYWAAAGVVGGLACGYLVPHDVRSEVSNAAIRALSQPLSIGASQ